MAAEAGKAEGAEAPPARGGRKKLVLLALPLLLAGAGAGLWFSGVFGAGHAAEAPQRAEVPPPAFIDMPEIITNLNVPGRRPVFLKLRSKIEVSRGDEVPAVQAAMPRLMDLFQTYLREMRPEELRGSAGTYRLREELLARANIAVAPARITDVLFIEIIVQ
ncbi:flagellar basal body-associated FliL family protein [Plastoroseomonas hellenica]|uniref:Flagellar protein FliL n=1 Tax=Plastoroseomonas hellenica TaxID=2687306 RepID=A0ABS5F0P0_9PROT|nr:flagellar basal body-associated FliL family protein [Plastoroseomonas hellenica]MBR0643455.1 flagellar basal body protein FliL [Plastoroseomonas hellenica]MBR0665745.1 flagellar basal body protein FliL [Plastoroseomonas hellenica]